MEEQERKTAKTEVLLKNLSVYISGVSFWIFTFSWNYFFDGLEFVARLGLGAALSWVVFLHVEAIGMIIMSMMRERMEAQMEARIVARLEARAAQVAAQEAKLEARSAGARSAGAGNHPRLAATAQRGARRRRERRRRRLDTERPRDSRCPRERYPARKTRRCVPATPPPPTPAAPPRARPRRPARARPRPYARPARARDGGTRRASPKA